MMKFSLRNAAQTSQRLMDQVVRGLEVLVIYIDNILVASSSPRQHESHLRQLFTRLQKYGLRIHPSKCFFGEEIVDFLGLRVYAEGVGSATTVEDPRNQEVSQEPRCQ